MSESFFEIMKTTENVRPVKLLGTAWKEPFGGTPKGTRETRVLPLNRFRKDCILGNLPAGQRTQVDKWLFDKGMTYAQVAEACGRMFRVKVSRSSVGRYYERMMKGSVTPETQVSELANQRISECNEAKTWEEKYEVMVRWLMDLAMEAMARYEFELKHEGRIDRREARWVVTLMKLVIAARRARNQGEVAAGERAGWEIQKAKLNIQNYRKLRGRRGDFPCGLPAGRFTLLRPGTAALREWNSASSPKARRSMRKECGDIPWYL